MYIRFGLSFLRPGGDQRFPVNVSKAGYVSVSRSVAALTDQIVNVKLKKKPRRPAKPGLMMPGL